MNYPTKLRIGDVYYRIRFVKSIRRCKKKVGEGAIVGICDQARHEILIKQGMSKDETLKTYLHELGHAIEFEYDIKISHKAIYQYEEAIFDFICANSDAFSK